VLVLRIADVCVSRKGFIALFWARLEVLTKLTVNVTDFWGLAPCGLVKRCQHFGGTISRLLYLRRKVRRYSSDKRPGRYQSRFRCCEEDKYRCRCWESNSDSSVSQPVSGHWTYWAVPTALNASIQTWLHTSSWTKWECGYVDKTSKSWMLVMQRISDIGFCTYSDLCLCMYTYIHLLM
jgi:hypothetical protein